MALFMCYPNQALNPQRILNLNLNSFLVKRQNDNPVTGGGGGGGGELVPSSHKRSELRHTALRALAHIFVEKIRLNEER